MSIIIQLKITSNYVFLFDSPVVLLRKKTSQTIARELVKFAGILVVNQIGNCLICMYQGQITSKLVVQI